MTLTAGAARFPWRRFAILDALAAAFWASYAALLGYFGGKAFEQMPWAGLLLALAIAFAVTGVLELIRAYARHQRAADPGTAPGLAEQADGGDNVAADDPTGRGPLVTGTPLP